MPASRTRSTPSACDTASSGCATESTDERELTPEEAARYCQLRGLILHWAAPVKWASTYAIEFPGEDGSKGAFVSTRRYRKSSEPLTFAKLKAVCDEGGLWVWDEPRRPVLENPSPRA